MLKRMMDFNNDIVKELKEKAIKDFNGVCENVQHPHREDFLRITSNARILLKNFCKDSSNIFLDYIINERLGYYFENNYTRNIIKGKKNIDIEKSQSVFITAHLGAYKILNHYLILNKGINICLVISEEAKKEFEIRYFDLFNKYCQRYKSVGDFVILNAEDSKLFFKMKKYYKNNFSFLFYMDGNTGEGGTQVVNKNMKKISFCNVEFFVRKGMSYVSKIFNIPIVPIFIPLNTGLIPELNVFPKIFPRESESIEDFSNRSISDLWDILANYVQKVPYQWQGLNFIDMYYLPDQICEPTDYSPEDKLKFDKDRFKLLVNEGYYIFDTFHCKKYKLSKDLFLIIERIIKSSISISFEDFRNLGSFYKRLLSFFTLRKDSIQNEI